MMLDGVTIVVSPLIALMKDQIDALQARGIVSRRLDSTLSPEQYREVMMQMRSGQLLMLYVAPERFNNERFREALQQIRVALFAIDEAHCISEWGHNFRPDYLKLVEYAKLCRAERVLALTATATPQVLEDICRAFQIDRACATSTGFYRPNLTLLFEKVPAAARQESRNTGSTELPDRDKVLLSRIADRPPGSTIVYVTLQKTAEQVASRLVAAGFEAKAYHAGMEDEDRARVQDWFVRANSGIVVATIAFGMGIDKADIRYIYHYNLPKSLENYSQEIGRAGRDGQPAICEMLVCPSDLYVLENFAYGDTPTLAAVQSLIREIFSKADTFDISYYELSSRHDIRLLVVRTLLTYLELLGYLESGTPFYAGYRFQPLLSSAEILQRFEGERREFLRSVLAQAKKARTWYSLDAEQVARKLQCPRARVIRALDYLAEQRMLRVEAQGTRIPYQVKKACTEQKVLAEGLHTRAVERERREIERLHQVLALASRDGCQTAALCEHFGQSLADSCGHCSWCLGQAATPEELTIESEKSLSDQLLSAVHALRRQHPEALAEPEQAARLLCGLTSPKLSKAKLTSHSLFGAASEIPYQEILARIEQ